MDQVDEVKQKTDIVALINGYVPLKKAGRNYKANCPFHNEKTPSFMVSPELQMYKCFACGEAGDVFSFLEKYEGMDFGEALKFLADKAGIKLDRGSFSSRGEKDYIFDVNSLASNFYHYILLNHPSAKKALYYLTQKRGLKIDTIKKFKLGYSPKVSQPLIDFLTKKRGLDENILLRSGIFFKKGTNILDRFDDRVVFPIFDHRGNTVGFTGRMLPGDARDMGKYVNTPETSAYHKSNILYGLNFSKEEIKRQKEATLVEGQMDLISLWQAGYKNCAAISGTALTREQVDLLLRFTPKIILSLDADSAGNIAARRGIVVAQEAGLEIKIVSLGEYKDPDEMVRKFPEAFGRAVKKAVGVWEYYVDSTFAKYKSLTGEDKQNISRELVPILASIPDKIVQSHYVNLVAEKLGVPVSSVYEEVEKILKKGNVVVSNELVEEKKEEKTRRRLLEESLLSILFQVFPEKITKKEEKAYIQTHALKRIVDEFLVFMPSNKKFNASEFSKKLSKELVDVFSTLFLEDLTTLLNDPQKAEIEVNIIKKELDTLELKERIVSIKEQISKFEAEEDEDGLRKAQEEFSETSRKLVELEEQEGKGIY